DRRRGRAAAAADLAPRHHRRRHGVHETLAQVGLRAACTPAIIVRSQYFNASTPADPTSCRRESISRRRGIPLSITSLRSPLACALALAVLVDCGGSDATPTGPAKTPVAAVTVTGSSSAMVVGSTLQLTAAAVDANGATLTDRTITWTSSDTAVATVTASGLVSALASGSATIQATAETKSGSMAISVTATANLATVSGDAQAGLTARPLADSLTVKVTTPTGAPAAGTTVTWSATSGTLSSPTAVA